jgi:hypothetical protein
MNRRDATVVLLLLTVGATLASTDDKHFLPATEDAAFPEDGALLKPTALRQPAAARRLHYDTGSDVPFVILLVCISFLIFVCCIGSQRIAVILWKKHRDTLHSKVFHVVNFRRLRSKVPEITSPTYLEGFKLQEVVKSVTKSFTPPQDYPQARRIRDTLNAYQDQLANVGKWTQSEQKNVMDVAEVLLKFFQVFMDTLQGQEAKFQNMMRRSYRKKKHKYLGVYNSVLRGVIQEEDDWLAYTQLVAEMQELVSGGTIVPEAWAQPAVQARKSRLSQAGPSTPSNPATPAPIDPEEFPRRLQAAQEGLQPCLNEDPASMIKLMQDSLRCQKWLTGVCEEIASATANAKPGGGKQKGLYRCIEKYALESCGREAPLNHCTDAARDMIRCKDVTTICAVLKAFMERMRTQELLIVKFEDRFSNPDPGGWGDALLWVVRVGDPSFHVAEVQIVHNDLMAVRFNMGAHKDLYEFRAIAEIFSGLAWPMKRDGSTSVGASDLLSSGRPSVVSVASDATPAPE